MDFFSGGRAIYDAFSQRLGTHSSENLVWIDFKKCFGFLFEYMLEEHQNDCSKPLGPNNFMQRNKVYIAWLIIVLRHLLCYLPAQLFSRWAVAGWGSEGCRAPRAQCQCQWAMQTQTLAVEQCLSAIQALLLLRRFYEVMDRGDRNDLTSVPFPQKCFELSPDHFLSSETIWTSEGSIDTKWFQTI